MNLSTILEFLSTYLSLWGWWIGLFAVIGMLVLLFCFNGIVKEGMRSGREIRIGKLFHWRK